MSTHTWLRLIHIVTGVLWTGSVVFLATMLVPAIRAAGPSGGGVMRELMQNRKMPVLLAATAWLAILSGGTLAYIDAGPLGFRWFERGAGLVFGMGAVAALAALLVGVLVNAPTGKRMGALAARLQAEGRPPTAQEAAQLGNLQDTLFNATRLAALLLLLATGLMAVARSFG